MNVSEANAVNHLLRHLFGLHASGGRHVSSEAACLAAGTLAGKAYATLKAGLTTAEVAEQWPGFRGAMEAASAPESPACRVCGCTEDAPCGGGCLWVPNPLGVDLCSACADVIATVWPPGSTGDAGDGEASR